MYFTRTTPRFHSRLPWGWWGALCCTRATADDSLPAPGLPSGQRPGTGLVCPGTAPGTASAPSAPEGRLRSAPQPHFCPAPPNRCLRRWQTPAPCPPRQRGDGVTSLPRKLPPSALSTHHKHNFVLPRETFSVAGGASGSTGTA